VRILAVHSSTPHLGVAVTQDGQTIAEIVLPPGKEHLEHLAPTIAEMKRRLGFDFSDVDGFGVAVGPGSFSGIRIGLATVKGMALALHKPVAGISSLEVLAWDGLREGELGASVIDAKRGQIYTCMYRKEQGHLISVKGPLLLEVDRFLLLLNSFGRSVTVCGDKVPGGNWKHVASAVRGRGEAPSPSICARLAENRIRTGRTDNIHSLAPLYIRRSDAEEKKFGEGQRLIS
jgi:tRNA threonylcarbamoyladenosine biosynthesis protein TsaB